MKDYFKVDVSGSGILYFVLTDAVLLEFLRFSDSNSFEFLNIDNFDNLYLLQNDFFATCSNRPLFVINPFNRESHLRDLVEIQMLDFFR